MIRIPAGTFLIGSDRHYPEEAPAHRVRVAAFEIDETAVTNLTVAERPLDPAASPTPHRTTSCPAALSFT
jgi:hypothetical protein